MEGAQDDDVQNGAEIVLSPDGKTIYASVRNYNRTGAMLVFSVHGAFERIQCESDIYIDAMSRCHDGARDNNRDAAEIVTSHSNLCP